MVEVLALGQLSHAGVLAVAHHGEAEQGDDHKGEPEQVVGGEAGRQETPHQLDSGQCELTGEVEDEGVAYTLTVVTRLTQQRIRLDV